MYNFFISALGSIVELSNIQDHFYYENIKVFCFKIFLIFSYMMMSYTTLFKNKFWEQIALRNIIFSISVLYSITLIKLTDIQHQEFFIYFMIVLNIFIIFKEDFLKTIIITNLIFFSIFYVFRW